MVKMAPETATAAELKNMEQDLDAAGQLISRLQRELFDERHAYDAINARYTQMMGAAENLQHQIDAAGFLKEPLQASSATLVAQIEEMVPELDQDKKDIDATQALIAFGGRINNLAGGQTNFLFADAPVNIDASATDGSSFLTFTTRTAVVLEPASLALLGTALVGLGLIRRRV
jgi:hypothetical protein